jgi:PAS domain S-box-containing protein
MAARRKPAMRRAYGLRMGALYEDLKRDADLFAFVPNACLVTDLAGTILQANFAAERMLGAAAEALRGRPLEHYVPMEQRRIFRSKILGLTGGLPQATWPGAVRCAGRDIKVEFSAAGIRRPGLPLQSLCWLLRALD